MVELVDLRCPGCGASLNVARADELATCEYCGASFPVDDGAVRLKIEGAELAGYEFEKGRQRARAEAAASANATAVPAPRKRRTWLWVLGWIFIFPVPLTVLMLRTDKIGKPARVAVVVVAWLVYLAIAASSGSG